MAKKATQAGQDALASLMALAGAKPKPGKTKIPSIQVEGDEATAIRNWYQGTRLLELAKAMVSNAESSLTAVADRFRREKCLESHSIINSVKLQGETEETPPIVSLHVTPRIAAIIKETLSGQPEDDAVEVLHQIQTETKPYEGEVRATQTMRFTNMKPECINELRKEFEDNFDDYFEINNFIQINASKLSDQQQKDLADVIASVLKKNKVDPTELVSSEVKVEPTEKFHTDVMTDEKIMRSWDALVGRTGYCKLQKLGFYPSGTKE